MIFRATVEIGIQPIDQRHAGRELELRDGLRRQAIEHHHQGAQRVAVRGNQDALAAQDGRQHGLAIIGQDPGNRILQAFAARRRHIVGPPPNLHLVLAPSPARIILVEAGQIAVIAFVQGLIGGRCKPGLSEFLEHQVQRRMGAQQSRGEGAVKMETERLQFAARRFRLLNALRREVGILPAGEEIFQIPIALAMPNEDEETFHGSPLSNQKSESPSTSAIE